MLFGKYVKVILLIVSAKDQESWVKRKINLWLRCSGRCGIFLGLLLRLDPARLFQVRAHMGDLPVGVVNETRVGLRQEEVVEVCTRGVGSEERTGKFEELS